MAESTESTLRVSKLLKKKFYIPAYQRAYRWTKRQVEDLLNDIYSFALRTVNGSPGKTWYCLQPLVVKPKESAGTPPLYELVDGQQRVATIFLIVHYINEKWRGEDKEDEPSLTYAQGRGKTSQFLKDLNAKDGKVEIDDSNIDHHYMSLAYQTIHEWVMEQKKNDFRKDKFISTFLDDVRVIWYETAEKEAVDIFTRINMGKIPLTNAELIKALFLNSSNFGSNDSDFGSNDSEKIRLRQLEIAGEWDRIEASLQEPALWYFLNDHKADSETLIDFIFAISAERKDNDDNDDEYALFRYYSEKLNPNQEDLEETGRDVKQRYQRLEEMWRDVKQCYQRLEEWFSDRELYHKIGYLLTSKSGKNSRNLIQELSKKAEVLSKSDFVGEIDGKIADLIQKVDIDSLEYENRKDVRMVLLLHNVLTMLRNNNETSRFPFDVYKRYKWDVEHIHSVHEEMPENDKERREWLCDSIEYIEEHDDLKKKVSDALKDTKELDDKKFDELSSEVLKGLGNSKEDSYINGLSNLALLDRRTNRGYKNAVYPVKREWIIEREKVGEFVPICTKNVFTKWYSKKVETFTCWGKADRKAYNRDIESVLRPYIIGGNQ